MPNAFERLLGTIADAEARLKFTGLAESAPEIKDWIVDPQEVERANRFSQWAEESWDSDHDMPKAEYQLQQRVRELETTLQGHGEGMTLEELNGHLGSFMSEKKLVTSDMIDARASEINQLIGNMANVATVVPYLNQKHMKEFGGEMFDPQEFLTKANDAGAKDLRSYYNEFTAEKREAMRQADVEAKIAAAKEEGKREGLQARAMATDGQMPTLDGSPELGHFQAKLMGIAKTDAAGKSPVPVDAELGKGHIARAAARAGDLAEMSGRVN